LISRPSGQTHPSLLHLELETAGVFTYMKLTESFKLSTSVPKDSQTELGLGLRMSL